MELNWSTFLLEIINFLVLVWILKRFLYKPVLDVIAARRKSIEDQLSEAHTIKEEAESLRVRHAGRLQEWETQKSQAKDELARDIEQERAHRLSAMRSALELEKEKMRVAEERRQNEWQRAIEQQALLQGAAFSSRLLEQAAGPDLEARLLDLVIDDLKNLSASQLERLREQWTEPAQAVDVSSAFALSAQQRERLIAAVRDLCGESATVHFRQDEQLIAGLRIVIGSWVLAANVHEELKGFAGLAHAPRQTS